MSDETLWKAATWEGARREQLRRALRLSVRERLEALETLAETSERLLPGKLQTLEHDVTGRSATFDQGVFAVIPDAAQRQSGI